MKEDNYTTITLTSSINIKPSNLRGDINKIILNIHFYNQNKNKLNT